MRSAVPQTEDETGTPSAKLGRRALLISLGASLGAGLSVSQASRSQPGVANNSAQLQYYSRHSLHPTDEHPMEPAGRRVSERTKKLNPMAVLQSFDYGQVSHIPDGRVVRDFTLVATEDEVEIAEDIAFEAWMFNRSLPGPTLRCTQGDFVRVRFVNQTERRHSIHIHGFKPAEMDGVEPIQPGEEFVYEFTAEPFGLFPYHCHIRPVNEHIQRGLYGALIIDPKTPRPKAHELVIVLNSYDLDSDQKNDVYSINGVADYFMEHPIPLKVGELTRLYLLNMVEFDPVVSLHLHASMFNIYRSGSWLTPQEYTDLVTLAQAERAILEFAYQYPGQFMFHPHQSIIAERGCAGFFEVRS
jgi:FtsP/CotA-like multicopper oxidase with cupredoxin domain